MSSDLPVSVPEFLAEVWVSSLLRSPEYNSACTNPFEGGCHYFHYSYHSLASGQTTGRENSTPFPPSTENWIKDLLSMALPCTVFPLVSLSHHKASISLLSLSIRGQTE